MLGRAGRGGGLTKEKAPGFEERKQLYLLYHYLNHYNLFGSGYYGQCESILRRLGG